MTPYISVVIVGRNDDYGENFQERLATFVRHLDRQAASHPDLFELIIVEWNPLHDRPSIEAILPAINALPTRIITVPNQEHERFGAARPVLEFAGKNVGIRRSHGRFVLTTNPDIIFSDPLVDYLAQCCLQENTVYRTDRYDFVNSGIEHVDTHQLVSFAASRTFQAHISKNNASVCATVDPTKHLADFPKSDTNTKAMHTNACGDFILAAKSAFANCNGLNEDTAQKWHIDSYSLIRLLSIPLQQQILVAPRCIFHADHARAGSDAAWNPQLALDIGRLPGGHDWGLNGVDLTERTL